MVPREAGRGSSFKGAGLYYLHDKEAQTSERVAFTQCDNLPTQDPQKALGWMAWTAMIAPELKRKAGVAPSGRKATKPVFTVSLAWHPDERKPSQAEMIAQGRAWLTRQGLQEHQVVMVAHADRSHPHIHLIVNLVHPVTGKTHRLPFSRLKSSRYAQDFEQASGVVRCPERVENNRRRGYEGVLRRAAQADLKTVVSALYKTADTGRALQAALKGAGLILARGKRLVVVAPDGKVHNLTRLLDGVKAKALIAKLGTLGLPSIQTAQATLAASKKKVRASVVQPLAVPLTTSEAARAKKALQAQHVQELLAFRFARSQERDRLTEKLDVAYGAHEQALRKEIALLERRISRGKHVPKLWSKLRGRAKADTEALGAARAQMENLSSRRQEAFGALDSQAMQQERSLLSRHSAERHKLEQGQDVKDAPRSAEEDRNARALAMDRARTAKKLGLHRSR